MAARTLIPSCSGPAAREVLARTLWGEARGEGLDGLRAVAAVIVNRACFGAGYWWGDSVEKVCTKPWQFSCWNAQDPNRAKLEQVTPADEIFARCLRVADEALAGRLPDLLEGATHYHHRALQPAWAHGQRACRTVGSHLFYNSIERPRRG